MLAFLMCKLALLLLSSQTCPEADNYALAFFVLWV
jgi:hypothetical protein